MVHLQCNRRHRSPRLCTSHDPLPCHQLGELVKPCRRSTNCLQTGKMRKWRYRPSSTHLPARIIATCSLLTLTYSSHLTSLLAPQDRNSLSNLQARSLLDEQLVDDKTMTCVHTAPWLVTTIPNSFSNVSYLWTEMYTQKAIHHNHRHVFLLQFSWKAGTRRRLSKAKQAAPTPWRQATFKSRRTPEVSWPRWMRP